jgi:uncharacterized UPF0160 family protein
MAAPLKIGVPKGEFHADIVFAFYVLKRALGFESFELLRLSPVDSSRYCECDYLLGIGGVYDHERGRYDYHQPESATDRKGALCFPRFTMRMSAAGLIYYHFGRDAIEKILRDPQFPALSSAPAQLPPEYFEFHYESLYTQFVQEIDGRALHIELPPAKYEICTGIWTRVEEVNPIWTEVNPDCDAAFRNAVALVEDEFANLVRRGRDYGYREYQATEEAYHNRFLTDPGGKIIEFKEFVLCYPYLTKFEKDFIQLQVNTAKKNGDRDAIDRAKVLFMIYQRPTKSWTVRGISSGRGFTQRKKLPVWSPQVIREKTGITDVKFVHTTGLLAIFETRESALIFAKRAIQEPIQNQ